MHLSKRPSSNPILFCFLKTELAGPVDLDSLAGSFSACVTEILLSFSENVLTQSPLLLRSTEMTDMPISAAPSKAMDLIISFLGSSSSIFAKFKITLSFISLSA